MRKKEILIVAGILLLAVVSLAAYRLLGRGKTATGKINVYVNGALYASEPLRPGQTLTVTQQDGSTNVIRMTEGGFYMESSSCACSRARLRRRIGARACWARTSCACPTAWTRSWRWRRQPPRWRRRTHRHPGLPNKQGRKNH